eukprot:gene27854-34411_t
MQKFTANDGSSGDYFGYRFALSGTHLVVGAYGDDSYQGSVYVYSVTDSGATFLQKVTANDGSSDNDRFGNSVALSGTHLVVGAKSDAVYAVYVYSVTDPGATFLQKVTANDGNSGDNFGYSVALSGTYLVVGAIYDDDLGEQSGSVYVYSVTDFGATFLQKVIANDGSYGDRFGISVALSGTHLVVGAYGDDSHQGSVYLHSVTDSGATFLQKVTANDGSSGDSFGGCVALSETHLVVGARGDYDLVSLGSVYVYSVTDSGATYLQKVKADDGNSVNFGFSVALSDTHLVVGTSGYAVYVYSMSNSGATFVQKITVNDGSSGDKFGERVALSGTHLVVGAYGDDSYRGSVYLA